MTSTTSTTSTTFTMEVLERVFAQMVKDDILYVEGVRMVYKGAVEYDAAFQEWLK